MLRSKRTSLVRRFTLFAIAICVLSLLAGRPGLAERVTVRFVKADRPTALISEGVLSLPNPVGYIMASWADNLSVDGKHGVTQRTRTVAGKQVPEKIAEIRCDLEDGTHSIWPGGATFVLKQGKLSTAHPALSIADGVITVKCYPARFLYRDKETDRWAGFDLRIQYDGKAVWSSKNLFSLTLYLPPNPHAAPYQANGLGFTVGSQGEVVTDDGATAAVQLTRPRPPETKPRPGTGD